MINPGEVRNLIVPDEGRRNHCHYSRTGPFTNECEFA